MNVIDKAKKYYLAKVIHTVKTTRPNIRKVPFMEIIERETVKPITDESLKEALESINDRTGQA